MTKSTSAISNTPSQSSSGSTAEEATTFEPAPQQTNKKKKYAPNWRDVVAGASAGAFSRTMTAPIERVKLLMQLQGSLESNNNNNNNLIRKKNAWHCAKRIYHDEGILSFWRGNLPSVMRVAGTAAINFTMMNYYRQVAVRPFVTNTRCLHAPHLTPEQMERRRKNITSLVSGGMAGGTATTLLYPIDFLRTRLAADLARGEKTGSYKFKGMRHAFMTILKSDGITGLYQGYGIALFGGIFYRILFLGGYDVMKSEWEHRKNRKRDEMISAASASSNSGLTWGERIVIAQAISLSAGTISYPLDSVRRRLMMQAGQPKEMRKYRHSIHCIRQVLAQEGIRGFFLGLGPNILRSVSGALLLVAYDVVKESLA